MNCQDCNEEILSGTYCNPCQLHNDILQLKREAEKALKEFENGDKLFLKNTIKRIINQLNNLNYE